MSFIYSEYQLFATNCNSYDLKELKCTKQLLSVPARNRHQKSKAAQICYIASFLYIIIILKGKDKLEDFLS